jgi:hypothetical protein
MSSRELTSNNPRSFEGVLRSSSIRVVVVGVTVEREMRIENENAANGLLAKRHVK